MRSYFFFIFFLYQLLKSIEQKLSKDLFTLSIEALGGRIMHVKIQNSYNALGEIKWITLILLGSNRVFYIF